MANRRFASILTLNGVFGAERSLPNSRVAAIVPATPFAIATSATRLTAPGSVRANFAYCANVLENNDPSKDVRLGAFGFACAVGGSTTRGTGPKSSSALASKTPAAPSKAAW